MPEQVLRQVREACAECPPRSQIISSSRYVFKQRLEGPDSNWMRAKYFTVVVPK